MTQKNLKEYRAIILTRDLTQPGLPVTVMAATSPEAVMLLTKKYGNGNVFDVHNLRDASTFR
ncbi:hypothetical protein K8640_11300 [Myxococcus sp. XM-1-1-1]|uniref:hypothetical protein n=1 Tax=Myxococcus sp. XM-1-1-1 TaxID=2874602 RepID=UPI001CBB673D|nr:hypothetical protein [Myxococcus sp. XM-1-1-1]MBZ4408801.1 hypothetical protein [Myxococcus sp. XM-1-1-1]